MSGETIGWLFQKAIGWELSAHGVYTSLSGRFSAHPDVGAFWKGMADDELLHAEEYRAAQRSLTSLQLDHVLGAKELGDALEVESLWSAVGERELRTLQDCYETAHELESSEINSIFQFVMLDMVSDSASRRFLVSQIEEHIGRLDDFGRRYDKALRSRIPLDTNTAGDR